MSIKASMEEMIDPKIEIKLVKSKQKYFNNLKTLKDQNQQAQGKMNKIQWQMKIKWSRHASKNITQGA